MKYFYSSSISYTKKWLFLYRMEISKTRMTIRVFLQILDF